MGEKTNSRPIEFWFDFASAYAYFASLEIELLANRHSRTVLWRPFTLGAAFKVTGSRGLTHTPLKGEYAYRDWQRIARLKKVSFNPRPDHPLTGLPAIRAFYAVDSIDAGAASKLAETIIKAYFCDCLDIDDPQSIAKLAGSVGIDPDFVLRGISDPEVKARARSVAEAGVAMGVCGSPWIIVDGEPFWGSDRMEMAELWLTRGPW
jgi:2-hydroxychromene-2-carboxylate isomerase